MPEQNAREFKKVILSLLFREGVKGPPPEDSFNTAIFLSPCEALRITRNNDLIEIQSVIEGQASFPTMSFEIGIDLKWRPISLTRQRDSKQEAIFYIEGHRTTDPETFQILLEFSREWAWSLREQNAHA